LPGELPFFLYTEKVKNLLIKGASGRSAMDNDQFRRQLPRFSSPPLAFVSPQILPVYPTTLSQQNKNFIINIKRRRNMELFIPSAIVDENPTAIKGIPRDFAPCKSKGRICRLLTWSGKNQL
jgi:hypothetical protein